MRRIHFLLILLLLLSPASLVLAQSGPGDGDSTPTPAPESTPTLAPESTPTLAAPASTGIPQVHIVQPGETLFSIATQFETTVEEIQLVNNLSDSDLIFAGQELLVPGGEGDAIRTAYTVQVGDTLRRIAAAFNTSSEAIAANNRLVRPDALYVGQPLSIVSRTGSAAPRPASGALHVVEQDETLLNIAAQYALAPAELATANQLAYPVYLYPGMRLYIPAGEREFQELAAGWQFVRGRGAPWTQGETVAFYVETSGAAAPEGDFAGQQLRFAPSESGFVALAGIDAFTEPGIYTLTLRSEGLPEFAQQFVVQAAGFTTQTITVPEELSPLLEPSVRANEDAFLTTIFGQFTPEQYWEGQFQIPVTNTVVTAGYGGARSYNGGPFDIYHTGIDFGGTVGTSIRAPAAGMVVFSGPLELRGNTVIIDHGLGVMSAYYHLDQAAVLEGNRISAGQVIGSGGSTGLSTGPHLHWDVRVLNVPVNGEQWLAETFP